MELAGFWARDSLKGSAHNPFWNAPTIDRGVIILGEIVS